MRMDLHTDGMERVLAGARRGQLRLTAREALPLMVVECPVGEGPPEGGVRLRDNHEIEGPDPQAHSITIVNNKRYTAPVHEGSRPHAIPNAFGRGVTVMHPGNKANPWMRRALDRLAEANF